MVGFMVTARAGIGRGERLMVALPKFGRIEALCIWTRSQQAGFLFERPLPTSQLERVVDSMKAVRPPSIERQPKAESLELATSEMAAGSLRNSGRKRAIISATLCMPDGWKNVRVKDYSDTGVRFFSNHSIPVGIDVIFKLGEIFSAARVVWSTGTEAGLEFYREISD